MKSISKTITAMTRTLGVCALTTGMVTSVHAEWVDKVADAMLEIQTDSNINRSAFPVDERDDTVTSAQVSAGRYFQFNPDGAKYTRLRLTADLELRSHDEFNGLDRTNFGATASVTHKLGLGPDQPWVRFQVSALHESVDDASRDKEIYILGLLAGKQYTERFGASVGLSYNIYDGKNDLPPSSPPLGGEVYDLEHYILSANASYQVHEKWLLSGFYSYLNGELSGECTPANVAIVRGTIPITAFTVDNVFGGCRYRFDGSAHTLGFAGTYAINPHASINLGVNISEGGRGEIDYESEKYFANFRYSH